MNKSSARIVFDRVAAMEQKRAPKDQTGLD
jgi:hypothetical protein